VHSLAQPSRRASLRASIAGIRSPPQTAIAPLPWVENTGSAFLLVVRVRGDHGKDYSDTSALGFRRQRFAAA
jgi:hypothetical protein